MEPTLQNLPAVNPVTDAPQKVQEDASLSQTRFGRLKSWFWQEMRRQSANRHQMALDEDYYDSLQHTNEESAVLLERGQMPVSWNEIKPTIDWLIGTERRSRTDFQIISRNDDSDDASNDARKKTKLLKYLDDVNRVGFERSDGFARGVKAGLGWIETGVRGDPDREPLYTRSESWRNILYDSLGTRNDLDDSRYLFRFRWVDLDVAIAYFPEAEAKLRLAATTREEERYMNYWMGRPLGGEEDFAPTTFDARWTFYDAGSWQSNTRERVLLIEAWSKEPFAEKNTGAPGTYDRTYMRMRLTIMTEDNIICEDWSPYKHNRFPFIPIWCYRRARDNAPYGVVRALRGPQDVLNKSMSKSIWEASANQIVMEKGAIDVKVMGADTIRDEASAPDGQVILADGGMEKFKFNNREDRITGHMRLADRGIDSIRSAGGVTNENLGQDSNAHSGKAINLKQEQGSTVTAEIFDNLLLARQLEGEITLSLVEQYMGDPKIFSITGDRGKYEYERINQRDPVTGQVIGDITARAAQYVIGEQAWKQTIMQAAFESMLDLLGNLSKIAPDVVKTLLPFVMELGDFPNKKAMISKLRESTGQPDPDEPMTPEQQKAAQQAQQLQDAEFTSKLAQLQADVKKAAAEGANLDAKSLLTTITAIYEAVQGAQVIAQIPGIAPIADELLKSSGFNQAPGVDPQISPPAPPAPAATAQPAAPVQIPPQASVPALKQAGGALAGIKTERADGVSNA